MRRSWCLAGASLLLATGQFGGTVPLRAAGTTEVRDFMFSERKFGDWDLRAETRVRWSGSRVRYPYFDGVSCHARSEDLAFNIDESSSFRTFSIQFQGEPDEGGYRQHTTFLGDRLWLYLDDRRWELAQIGLPGPEFDNVEYRKPGEDQIIIPIWRGSTYLRRDEGDPWMHLHNNLGAIIAARKIEWGFKSRNWNDVDRSEPDNQLPKDWKTRRYRVRNDGLREAVNWCLKAVRSKAARMLPGD